MARFLVKRTLTATEEHGLEPAGTTHTYITGKGGMTLFEEGDGSFDRDWMTPDMIVRFGYKRLCDAKRSWMYTVPDFKEYWHTEVQILTFNDYGT